MTIPASVSDEELRQAAAALIATLHERGTRESAMVELATAEPVRRGSMAGFVLPALAGREQLDGVLPEHGFVWLVLASSSDELEQALRFA